MVAIDTKKLKVLARIPTGPRPRAIIFTARRHARLRHLRERRRVTVFDAVKNGAGGDIKIEPVAKTPLGPRPMGAALAPDGKHALRVERPRRIGGGRRRRRPQGRAADRRRRPPPLGHRRQRRRQARLHRQRPLQRRLGRRRSPPAKSRSGSRSAASLGPRRGHALRRAARLRQRPGAEVAVATTTIWLLARSASGALHARTCCRAVEHWCRCRRRAP